MGCEIAENMEVNMSISSLGPSIYTNTNGLTSAGTAPASTANGLDSATTTGTTTSNTSTSGVAGNNSVLSLAIAQALAQLNAGSGITSLLSSDTQQSSSDFMSSLLSAVQGTSSNSSSTDPLSALLGYTANGQATPSVAPVTLDQSSPTIQLQASIQNLITQLDGNSSTGDLLGVGSNSNSGLQDLQQSFNSLVTASGGNPTQASLQSFLKMVAVSVQGSMSVGSLFDTSA
jgi:hypothetical protein